MSSTVDYKNPKLIIETSKIEKGSVIWRSPSNLAIIKYWGKHGRQLPRNPSISFTLDNAYTETHLEYSPKTGADVGMDVQFFFNDEPNEAFEKKVVKYLESISDIFPFLKQLHLKINSSNSFPHSAGIASSASSMSALALCICSLEEQLFGTLSNDEAFRQKASYVSRLGSGSACRSIYATMAIWGEIGIVENSSDLYAIPFGEHIHDIFKTYHDDILMINRKEKSVSSRAGHSLMDENIFADNRYDQARQRFPGLLSMLKNGDVEEFGRLTESEALTLHALMMTSSPPYILIKPNTLSAIEKIRDFREETKHPLYFSLDAGPNLHLLYPDEISVPVQEFIQQELVQFCEEGQWLKDKVGLGPIQL